MFMKACEDISQCMGMYLREDTPPYLTLACISCNTVLVSTTTAVLHVKCCVCVWGEADQIYSMSVTFLFISFWKYGSFVRDMLFNPPY